MTSQELSSRLLAPNPQDTEINVKRACEFEVKRKKYIISTFDE